jgi:pimeloyl-ACP methyl ester carboxylesterase
VSRAPDKQIADEESKAELGIRGGLHMAEFILVHGAFHGAWCWNRVVEELSRLGHAAIAVDLDLRNPSDDAALLGRAISAVAAEEVIVVGHSYGGSVISRACLNRPEVVGLVYIAALMLEDGEDPRIMRREFPPAPLEGHVEIDAGGMAWVSQENAISYFYNECRSSVAIEAARRLRPTAIDCVAGSSIGEPWRQIPATYVVCDNDLVMAPEYQRHMARNATQVVSLPTDHSPFLSAPQELARLLTVATRRVSP